MGSDETLSPAPPFAPATPATASDEAKPFSRSYVNAALWILMIVSFLNYVDRMVLNILAEPIKRDLGLSDTQLGLLTGLAFGLFYSTLALPLARLTDNQKTNRIGLIAVSMGVWSGMTMLCGMAQNFLQLFLSRVGIGIGEAGPIPAAHSLITDMVPRAKHASALAIFGLGAPLGGLVGLAAGGLIADAYGWRAAFWIAGAPGVLFALALPLFLKEPRRASSQAAQDARAAVPRVSVKEALAEVGTSKAYIYLVVAAAFVAFLSYGKAAWQAVLFIRVFGLTPGQAGLSLGLLGGIVGVLGTYLGGFLADRLGARRASLILAGPAIGLVLAAPLQVVGYLTADWRVALVLIVVPGLATGMFYGPTFSCVQRLVRPATRATAVAIMLFVVNVIGTGLGPLLFGIMSDVMASFAGKESLRWVLAGAAMLGFVPALFFWLAGRHLEREFKA
jgi:predicted MFS family arabinose efflux permease